MTTGYVRSTHIPHGLSNCETFTKLLIHLMLQMLSLSNPFQSIELRTLPYILPRILPCILLHLGTIGNACGTLGDRWKCGNASRLAG